MTQDAVDGFQPGRRLYDEACKRHEAELDNIKEELDTISNNVSKNSGRFAAMLWFMGIIGAALTIVISVAITMLSGIQGSLNSNQVTMMQHAEQIRALRDIEIPAIKTDLKDIQERHKYLDQNGVVKKAR